MTRPGRPWSQEGAVDLSARVAVVSGANSGVGLATAQPLAEDGTHVILACRDKSRGLEAADQIVRATRAAGTESRVLDLADLTSLRRFASAETTWDPADGRT